MVKDLVNKILSNGGVMLKNGLRNTDGTIYTDDDSVIILIGTGILLISSAAVLTVEGGKKLYKAWKIKNGKKKRVYYEFDMSHEFKNITPEELEKCGVYKYEP